MGKIGFANTSATSTTREFPLGSLYEQGDAQFIYLRCNASSAIDQYDLVTIDEDYLATAGTTTTSGARPTRCAIAQLAVAVDEYFWAPVGPFPESEGFKVNAKASCAADVKLYTHATAGHVDDTAADLVAGLVLTETVGGADAAATCEAVQRLVTNCQD